MTCMKSLREEQALLTQMVQHSRTLSRLVSSAIKRPVFSLHPDLSFL